MLIDVSDEEVVRRLGGRRTCAKNGHIFHVDFDPPKNEDVCDICGARLIVRDDDKPEVIRHRLETYHEKTKPLVDFYEERGVLKRVDGSLRAGGGRQPDQGAARDPADGRRALSGLDRPEDSGAGRQDGRRRATSSPAA